MIDKGCLISILYLQNKKVLYLELGVGMNTPVIIKYPFVIILLLLLISIQLAPVVIAVSLVIGWIQKK